MQFVTVRDFRSASREIWDKLSLAGEIVVTNNGKPTALLLDVRDDDIEDLVMSIRQAKAMRAYNRLHVQSKKQGQMSEDEIEAEIRAARDEYKAEYGLSL